MSSPKHLTPKGRAASIWSLDSGYGSSALDDDHVSQVPYLPSICPHPPQQPIGLGLGLDTFQHVVMQDQLRLTICHSPVELVTTKPARLQTDVSCHNRTRKPGKKSTPRQCSTCESPTASDQSGSLSCTSCGLSPGDRSPESPSLPSDVRRSCARRPAKLPSHALQRLQLWLQDNRSNPYPDAETKRLLAQECQITEKQVNTWFTNARARRLNASADRSTQPSEDEGQGESGMSGEDTALAYSGRNPFGYTTPHDPRGSDASTSTFAPSGTNQNAPGMSRRGKKKDYGQMNNLSPADEQRSLNPITLALETATQPKKELEMWQCTFCHQQIAPKSWRRHEETQHRPKRKWTCLLHGPRLTLPSSSNASVVCAFCMMENPSEEHFLHTHRIVECMKKSEDDRSFLRPDHLRQHVKNFHKVTLFEAVRDSWKCDGPGKDDIENWGCGFCGQNLKTWDIRETHIAGHFKQGLTMADWVESRRSDSVTQVVKRRRDSDDEEGPHIFTKFARTLPGRSATHQQLEPQNAPPPNIHFPDNFSLLPTTTGPPVSATQLLPDLVFDSFMAEVYGNPIDSFQPIVTTSDGQYFTQVTAPEPTFPVPGDADADLDALAAAFIDRSSQAYTGPWHHHPQ